MWGIIIMNSQFNQLVVEWDLNKDRLNIKKHGISFEVAKLVFADANRVEFYDSKHSLHEHRYITIGMVNNLISVVYTERLHRIRLITAKPASAKERKLYYGQNC